MFKKRRRSRRTTRGISFRWLRFLWPEFRVDPEARRGIVVIVLLTGIVVSVLAFRGAAGEVGETVNKFLVQLFGAGKWAVPIVFSFLAISLSKDRSNIFDSANVFGLFLFFISLSSLLHFFSPDQAGCVVGAYPSKWLIANIGEWGAAALLSGGMLVSLLLILNTSLTRLVGVESLFFKIVVFGVGVVVSPFLGSGRRETDGAGATGSYRSLRSLQDDSGDGEDRADGDKEGKAVVKEYDIEEGGDDPSWPGNSDQDDSLGPPLLARGGAGGEVVSGERWVRSGVKVNMPLSLLKARPKKPMSGNIEKNQEIIKKTLYDFGIPVSMGEIRVGPTVTQYSFKPANGIPVARIKTLSDDLALNLSLHPVRIEAPIPGKPLVGLEVPNQTKVLVTLKEVLQSRAFRNRKSNTMISLGRDVSGKIWFSDLAKLTHLLVAGATGSGKSICLHSIITSLIYQNDPDDLKFIMIDVKQVELSAYNDLPYLVAPVVTDNIRAVRALKWCLNEMDRRLETLSTARCQNIADYNRKKRFSRMPYLVIVIDELGDLLSTSRKEAEGAIIRLGQKARAAGIHMVLATQRPTVDIISGLIKANVPGRIAFSVTSSSNSKTILDFTGAEKLLGQGDMLFIDPVLPKPVRIQGAYIGEDEIRAVVKYARKKAGRAKYIDGVTETSTAILGFDDIEVDDELLEEAKRMIIESNRASASMLQSRLSIGYPRANRILDILEKQGVVGPSIQNKPREVLTNL